MLSFVQVPARPALDRVLVACVLAVVVPLGACSATLGGDRPDAGRADATVDAGPPARDAALSDSGAPADGGEVPSDAPPIVDAGPPEVDAGPICPPPGPVDCSPGEGSGEDCIFTESCFLRTVQNAVNQVQRDHPEWFDLSDGNPRVLDVEAYMDAVVALVVASGLCSIRDPNAGDEIVVKHDNGAAENFDILTATGYARSGGGIYTSTCIPAWF